VISGGISLKGDEMKDIGRIKGPKKGIRILKIFLGTTNQKIPFVRLIKIRPQRKASAM